MNRFTQEELDRFNEKWVKGKNGCHLWKGHLDRDGYGSFFFRRVPRRAHRVAYYLHVGDIPKGMVIDHVCAIRNCVSPSHLRLLTARENILDGRGVGAINARKTHCTKGHKLDVKYGKQRYCSICETEKRRRLYAKWKLEDTVLC